MSPCHLACVCQREIGMAPVRYVQAVCLDEAAQCGFASADALQRGFRQRWGVPPGKYRRGTAQR